MVVGRCHLLFLLVAARGSDRLVSLCVSRTSTYDRQEPARAGAPPLSYPVLPISIPIIVNGAYKGSVSTRGRHWFFKHVNSFVYYLCCMYAFFSSASTFSNSSNIVNWAMLMAKKYLSKF